MTDIERIERIRPRAYTGLDLSPGDDDIRFLLAQLDEADAEVEALTEALREIVEYGQSYYQEGDAGWQYVLTARAALAAVQKEEA